MLKIERVEIGSPAAEAGFRAGDRILKINGQAVRDFIDFYFYTADSLLEVEVAPEAGSPPSRRIVLRRQAGRPLGLQVDEGKLRRCGNKCIFCFVDQLPAGLRRSLYVKDEDYRRSFLLGNFITGTNLKREDVERIIRMGLGPLYISVHVTDPEIRSGMLGGCSRADVLPLLSELASGGIGLHCQVVLCPGVNDGAVLERTITDLEGVGPNCLSLAVVPVGLSVHRKDLARLHPVTPEVARRTLKLIHGRQREFLRSRGGRFVFAADELYLLAGRRIPTGRAYELYLQIENGVGLVRRSMDTLERALKAQDRSGLVNLPGRRYRLATGTMFSPLLTGRLLPRLAGKVNGRFEVATVVNSLLGESITVAGLLPGRDILAALRGAEPADVCLIPASALNAEGYFIDDLHFDRLRQALRPAAVLAAHDLAEALDKIQRL